MLTIGMGNPTKTRAEELIKASERSARQNPQTESLLFSDC
jgi:hypothetical protein